jgi:beta-glucuronidase
MLAPRESRSRECHRLDGLWRFRFDPGGEGTTGGWWRAPLCDAREMAVPASYNDLVTDAAEREHVGDVWYQRDVWVPAAWEGKRIVLRCDAATHRGAARGRLRDRSVRPDLCEPLLRLVRRSR